VKKWQLIVLLAAGAFFLTRRARAASLPLGLGAGFESLEALAGELSRLDERFVPATSKGRATLALALALGGTEVYSRGTSATDFFTRRGGTGNNMLGFAQYNLKYHADKTDTPEKYAKFTADILTGRAPMPNGKSRKDFAAALAQAVAAGSVRDLGAWMRQQGFGGSNWQGIDDGWKRVPGLSERLIGFVRGNENVLV
jgi:hypothetical protein